MSNEEKPEQVSSSVEQKPPKFTVQNLANAVPQINWSIIASFFGSLYNFTSRILWIFVVVVIATILIQGVTHHSTVIDLISVPKSLADNGYTSDVAAGRLVIPIDRMVPLADAAAAHATAEKGGVGKILLLA